MATNIQPPRGRAGFLSALCVFAFLAAVTPALAAEAPDGAVDLTGIDFASGSIARLDHAWLVWRDQALNPAELDAPGAPAPDAKGDHRVSHLATMRLKVAVPTETESWAIRSNHLFTGRIWVNGALVADTLPATRKAAAGPREIVHRFPGHTAVLDIVVENHTYEFMPLENWDTLFLGGAAAVAGKHQADLIMNCLIAGALFFMGFYHLTIFALRKNETAYLYFGISCLFMGVRCLITGDRVFLDFFPPDIAAWDLAFKVEYLSAHMVVPLLTLFFLKVFPRQLSRIVARVILAGSLLWLAVVAIFPHSVFKLYLAWYEYFLFAAALYIVVAIVIAAVRRTRGALVSLSGLALFMIIIVNDILVSNGTMKGVLLTPVGVFIYTLAQSLLLSMDFSRNYELANRLSVELKNINASMKRFVPGEVLSFLHKDSIVDIKLGDFSEQQMTVFFLDIRNFTALSEKMSPSDNFNFVNLFLNRFGPLVRSNNGFIDKYLGDGFMALFPTRPDDALRAALAMRQELQLLNLENEATRADPIRFGIGIHTGKLMLGTIGETNRMDSTVISDAVNTSSRLEQLTKKIGADILISGACIKAMEKPGDFPVSYVSTEKVKGKEESIEVYTI